MACLDGFFKQLPAEQVHEIDMMAMAMSAASLTSARTHLPAPDQTIAVDRFQVAKYFGGAVNSVRRPEHKELSASR